MEKNIFWGTQSYPKPYSSKFEYFSSSTQSKQHFRRQHVVFEHKTIQKLLADRIKKKFWIYLNKWWRYESFCIRFRPNFPPTPSPHAYACTHESDRHLPVYQCLTHFTPNMIQSTNFFHRKYYYFLLQMIIRPQIGEFNALVNKCPFIARRRVIKTPVLIGCF